MATRNIVPRADGEGKLGTAEKKWGEVNAVKVTSNGNEVVTGPASATDDAVAAYNGTTGKVIKSTDKKASDLVTGPASAVSGNLPVFDGTTGKVIKDAGFGPIKGPDTSIDGGIAVFDGTDGKAIKDAGFEPIKGPKSSTSGNVAIYDGTTGKVLKDGGITSNVWDVIIEDRKPQGTAGGTFTSGAWRTRNLNTLVFNHNSLASLGGNRFTLPAGTYCIDWDAPACNVGAQRSALYNCTTSTIVAYGTSATASSVPTSSNGTTVITITSPTSFEIRHICAITIDTYGFGRATNFGTEIYTRVRIKKIR
jgi:hypothetical protein